MLWQGKKGEPDAEAEPEKPPERMRHVRYTTLVFIVVMLVAFIYDSMFATTFRLWTLNQDYQRGICIGSAPIKVFHCNCRGNSLHPTVNHRLIYPGAYQTKAELAGLSHWQESSCPEGVVCNLEMQATLTRNHYCFRGEVNMWMALTATTGSFKW